MDGFDYWMIQSVERRLSTQIEGDEADIDSVRDGLTVTSSRLRAELTNLALCFNALVELLVEEGKLSLEDLRARVNAAVIAAEHERKAHSDASQDAWDAAKPR
jgi:hypothetical protein